MDEFVVYVFVNITLQEVYFGMCADVNQEIDALPSEITHWEFGTHYISNAVIIEEELSELEAFEVIREVQEKSLRNPQGKKILLNLSVPGKTPPAEE